MQVVDELSNTAKVGVAHIISVRPPARLADREIMLGPVARTVDAAAVGPAAALVGLDQRPAHHLLDRRRVPHKFAATFA